MTNDRAVNRRSTPKLSLNAPKDAVVWAWKKPKVVPFMVKNAGGGQMPGRIRSDVPWVTVTPDELDPCEPEQYVNALVHPERMPSGQGSATVTVVTESGDKASFTIHAERGLGSPRAMAAIGGVLAVPVALVLVGWGGVALWHWVKGLSAATTLVVECDPPSGFIYVNGELVSGEGKAEVDKGLPEGGTVEVKVELDGFKPWVQQVPVTDGGITRVQPELVLDDRVDWRPYPNHEAGSVDSAAVDAVFRAREGRLQTCVTRNVKSLPAGSAKLAFTVYAGTDGQVDGVVFGERNFESAEADACLRRELRAVLFPAFANGDYVAADRSIEVQIAR